MKNNPKRYIIDSSAFIAYLDNEDEKQEMDYFFEKADAREIVLYMPVVQYGEVLTCVKRKADSTDASAIQDLFTMLDVHITDITLSHADIASTYNARLGGNVGYADCYVVAAAIEKHATILTKDKDFELFAEDVAIEWVGGG